MTPDRRIASIWLPHLAFERWQRRAARDRTLPSGAAIVLASDGPHGPVIHAANATALIQGVRTGARVTDMKAIHRDLIVADADAAGDIALLERLSTWARRWCPWTAVDADMQGLAGLVLDITGSSHLFGGEDRMLADMTRRFATQGLTIRAAIAPTRAAAWALARYGRTPRPVVTPQDLDSAIATLPARALGLSDPTTQLLTRLGLKTVGDLTALPRAPLMRRFRRLPEGDNPLLRLDRARGKAPDPLSPPEEPQRFMVRAPLAEPVLDAAPLLPGLTRDLIAVLDHAGRGARRLRLTLYRIDGDWRWTEVATARASRDMAHLQRLLEGKLDHVDPGFGFDLVTLEAVQTEPLGRRQDSLDGGREAERDVAMLMDRLTARLGGRAVTRMRAVESHVPERAESRQPALTAPDVTSPVTDRDRPLRLIEPPEEVRVLYAVPEGPPARFTWRRAPFIVTRREGPERIAPEWWRDRPGTRLRDYYKVEVQDGRRFWIYREGILGDGRGKTPRWFLHGIFA